MSVNWLTLRQQQADAMQGRAQRSGNPGDSMAWERYTRKTIQMASLARTLETRLQGAYRIGHGLAVTYQGRPIYLEHVITGPGGVWLVEQPDPWQPDWLADLERSIAFFHELLGNDRHRFVCLVVQREPLSQPLPAGAHLVESAEVAISIIAGEPTAPALPEAAADEVWQTLHALAASAPTTPKVARGMRRAGWAGVAVVVAALLASLGLAVAIQELWSVLLWLFLIVLPAWLVVWLIQLIPWDGLRRALTYVWLALFVLLDSFIALGIFVFDR